MSAFYRAEGGLLVPGPLTRGPWSPDHQHGGPPLALLVRAVEAVAAGRHLARLCAEFRRPLPLLPLRVEVEEEHAGRDSRRLLLRLWAGERLGMEARALLLSTRPLDLPPPPVAEARPAPWPSPEALPPFDMAFFPWAPAYPQGVEVRLVAGAWGATPIAFWTRPASPLVEGEPTSPAQALALLADAQSGMGVPVDPRRYTFLNPNVDLHLARPPRGPWIGFAIRSLADAGGTGLSYSELRDEAGALGMSVQSLILGRR